MEDQDKILKQNPTFTEQTEDKEEEADDKYVIPTKWWRMYNEFRESLLGTETSSKQNDDNFGKLNDRNNSFMTPKSNPDKIHSISESSNNKLNQNQRRSSQKRSVMTVDDLKLRLGRIINRHIVIFDDDSNL